MAKKKTTTDADAREAARKAAQERHRQKAKERSRAVYADSSEIGPIPAVKDPKKKERWKWNLELFLVEAFPESTGLKPFSDAHKKVIARMQASILEGNDVWNCVFRGFAKTSIAIGAAIWALMFGHRKFIPLIAANKKFAVNLLRMVKNAIETNEILFEQFPEVCFPVRAMRGRTQRCNTQTSEG